MWRVSIWVYRTSLRIRTRLFTAMVRRGFRAFGPGSVLSLPIRLVGESQIAIGAGVTVGSGCWLQALKRKETGENAVISINDGTSIAGFCTISAAKSVIIEKNVLVARYVYIADHTHAHADRTVPILSQGITKVAPVRICEGAWLGQSVVVGPGVTIGRGAVVGANSVVTRDVPDFTVVAGSPARVLRPVDDPLSS